MVDNSTETKNENVTDPLVMIVNKGADDGDEENLKVRHFTSIFDFRNIRFSVKSGKAEKQILRGISGRVEAGHMLAILGPSGAGKTSLLNVLAMNQLSGKIRGSITLNGSTMTRKRFQEECFLVHQHDFHWPFLTCYQTLQYAAQLILGSGDHSEVIEENLDKLGLQSCRDTICGNEFVQGLSGGQQRRLSVAVALIKKPSLLLLDEATSGLDSAGAVAIVQTLKELAVSEKLIVILTIHQPNSRTYESFDQISILSKGRQAFIGPVSEADTYFESIGYAIPPRTNPADYFLDLVNADFTDDTTVDTILDYWQKAERRTAKATAQASDAMRLSFHSFRDIERPSWYSELMVMCKRCGYMVVKDPFLYFGRGIMFLLSNIFIAFTYWESRVRDQSFVQYYVNFHGWLIAIPSCMGVIAVYGLNAEFKALHREIKNGLVRPSTYLVAKTILILPIMVFFGLMSIGIPGYAIMNFLPSGFPAFLGFFSLGMYVWECCAEAFSVLMPNPILGMLGFIFVWFSAFIFAGVFLPEESMVWPLRAFYYLLPFHYTFRSFVLTSFLGETWENCIPVFPPTSPVCVDFETSNSTDSEGAQVLDALNLVLPLYSSEDTRITTAWVLSVMALFFKLLHVILVLRLSSRSATVVDDTGDGKGEGNKMFNDETDEEHDPISKTGQSSPE